MKKPHSYKNMKSHTYAHPNYIWLLKAQQDNSRRYTEKTLIILRIYPSDSQTLVILTWGDLKTADTQVVPQTN